MAILCENLLETSLKDLGKLQHPEASLKTGLAKIRRVARAQKRRWVPGIGCIACKASSSSERHYLSALEEWLYDEDFAERFGQSTGLCLFHIRATCEQWASQPALEAVTHVAKKWVMHLLKELREFQRKHDYRFKQEPRGSEGISPERSIAYLVGFREPIGGLEELQHIRPARR